MSKEYVKSNVVDSRTLMLGVGGMGSDIVLQVADMCAPGEADNISFVCMDTNVNDLRKAMNSDAAVYYVQTSSTQSVGNYLAYDADALDHWFPKNQTMYAKSVSEGAGQVRAISRLALNAIIKTGQISTLYSAIDDLFRKTGNALQQALRVVIVSSASGGTGSGIVLPLSMLIRDYVAGKYPNSAAIIRTTLLLPEVLSGAITDGEMDVQRRNAYATVKELNAFMMKGTGIFDTDESLSRFRDLHLDVPVANSNELRSLSSLPCDFCFLVDGQNSEGDTMVSLQQYKKQVALALYEQNIGPMQRNAFSLEDNVIREFANPGNYARNRFGGIGSSVISYPYEVVARYIAYGWAVQSIGGEGEAARWGRYDKLYRRKEREATKKFIPTTSPEFPHRSKVYVDELSEGRDKFSRELRGTYGLEEAEDRLDEFLGEFEGYILAAVKGNSYIASGLGETASLAGRDKSFYKDENKRGHAGTDKDKLRRLEAAVKKYVDSIARTTSEAVCLNENKTINEKEPYTLESLLKLNETILHPNAMRYMLYLLYTALTEKLEGMPIKLGKEKKTLATFAPNANESKFNVRKTKEEETTLDSMCTAENPARYDEDYYDQLCQMFRQYYKSINAFMEQKALQTAYGILKDYVAELNATFVSFYDRFDDNVAEMERRREDLLESVRFRNGDSVLNVLCDKPVLDELERATPPQLSEENMLESALCGSIFDAVKANVRNEREIQSMDVVTEDKRVDIFDQILLGYFESAVLRSGGLDMNVIDALAMEYRLRQRAALREKAAITGAAEGKLVENINQERMERYITESIARVQRLAAANIQRLSFGMSRELKLCAYNQSLDNMRTFRLSNILPARTNAQGADTISKHEMHFFTALYGLTPDRLDKFACAAEGESRTRRAGLYHEAYTTYAKTIGPDSTKDLAITSHIDKRWDSLAVLPELDFDFQASQMLHIHKAMIYALVFGYISHRRPSLSTDSRMVYCYENSDERLINLTVSNGTPCDEFYEILDAFYISPVVVDDVEKMKAERHRNEGNSSLNFEQTAFLREVRAFTLPQLHPGHASLFEIPLAYYESLPNTLRYRDEITAVVGAVVDTFREETRTREGDLHSVELLREGLMVQFELFIENYLKNPEMNHGIAPADNVVADTAYRRIKQIFEREMPVSLVAQERVQHMKDLLNQTPIASDAN